MTLGTKYLRTRRCGNVTLRSSLFVKAFPQGNPHQTSQVTPSHIVWADPITQNLMQLVSWYKARITPQMLSHTRLQIVGISAVQSVGVFSS